MDAGHFVLHSHLERYLGCFKGFWTLLIKSSIIKLNLLVVFGLFLFLFCFVSIENYPGSVSDMLECWVIFDVLNMIV